MTRFVTKWLAVLGLGLCLMANPSGFAQTDQESRVTSRVPGSMDPGVDRLSALRDEVGIDQKLGEKVPLDAKWTDELGENHTVGEVLKSGRPVLLVPAYFKCRLICNKVLNGVFDSLKLTSFQPGRDFELVVFSFDDREGPAEARAKKDQMMATLGRKRSVEGWHFWTGSPESIKGLTKAIGFRYLFEKDRDEYMHATGITVLTPSGEVSRYLMGINYPATQLQLALSEASGNRIGTLVDQVKMLCFTYDPASGKYSLVVMRLVQAGGVLTILSYFTFMGWNWFRIWFHQPAKSTFTALPGAVSDSIKVTPGVPRT